MLRLLAGFFPDLPDAAAWAAARGKAWLVPLLLLAAALLLAVRAVATPRWFLDRLRQRRTVADKRRLEKNVEDMYPLW